MSRSALFRDQTRERRRRRAATQRAAMLQHRIQVAILLGAPTLMIGVGLIGFLLGGANGR